MRNHLFPYWILFAYFAAGAVLDKGNDALSAQRLRPFVLVGVLLTALLIGTRFKVGGDWRSYQFMFDFVNHVSLSRALKFGDPGYMYINWVTQQWNGDIWWVNLFSAAIFIWGLTRLSQNQPVPALAILVAVPYLIIVVAMGYTRQSIAIGILMAGLAMLGRGGSVIRFALYVAVAALFHRTAVLVLPLVIFASERNRTLNIIAGAAASVLFFDLFLSESTDQFVKNYLETRYASQGAWIRVILTVVPAVLLLSKRGRLGFTTQEEKVWRYLAIAACTLPFVLVATPSSTAVDRVALYLIPLQVVVLSRAYLLFGNGRSGISAVIAYSFLVQLVWLNFASHSQFWVPYRSFMLEDTTDRRNDRRDRR